MSNDKSKQPRPDRTGTPSTFSKRAGVDLQAFTVCKPAEVLNHSDSLKSKTEKLCDRGLSAEEITNKLYAGHDRDIYSGKPDTYSPHWKQLHREVVGIMAKYNVERK